MCVCVCVCLCLCLCVCVCVCNFLVVPQQPPSSDRRKLRGSCQVSAIHTHTHTHTHTHIYLPPRSHPSRRNGSGERMKEARGKGDRGRGQCSGVIVSLFLQVWKVCPFLHCHLSLSSLLFCSVRPCEASATPQQTNGPFTHTDSKKMGEQQAAIHCKWNLVLQPGAARWATEI